MQITTGIITISDRASKGLYDDLGGPALKKAAEGYEWKVVAESLVPDEKRDIQRAIREQITKGCQLILTTGGTGVALRDVTPEAVREIAMRELPGFGEIMRIESMKITKNAILSRNLAVVVEKTLVICLPGKAKRRRRMPLFRRRRHPPLRRSPPGSPHKLLGRAYPAHELLQQVLHEDTRHTAQHERDSHFLSTTHFPAGNESTRRLQKIRPPT